MTIKFSNLESWLMLVGEYLDIHWYLTKPIKWHKHDAQKLTQSMEMFHIKYKCTLGIGYRASGIERQAQLMVRMLILGSSLRVSPLLPFRGIHHWKVFNFGCIHISSLSYSTPIRWSCILRKSPKGRMVPELSKRANKQKIVWPITFPRKWIDSIIKYWRLFDTEKRNANSFSHPFGQDIENFMSDMKTIWCLKYWCVVSFLNTIFSFWNWFLLTIHKHIPLHVPISIQIFYVHIGDFNESSLLSRSLFVVCPSLSFIFFWFGLKWQ